MFDLNRTCLGLNYYYYLYLIYHCFDILYHYFELDSANLDSDAVIVSDEELVDGYDENEFFDGYDENNTLNISTDSAGDQTDLELPDSNYFSAWIDEYINSLENNNNSDDVSKIGKQYVRTI